MFKVTMTIQDKEVFDRNWCLVREIEMPYIPYIGMLIEPGEKSDALVVTGVRYIIDSKKTIVELEGDLFQILSTFIVNKGKWKIEIPEFFEIDEEAQKEFTRIKKGRQEDS